MDKKQTIFDDLKECKGYIIGVISFATAVGTFMVEVMGFKKELAILGVVCVAVCMLFIGLMINKSERRQQEELESQKALSLKRTNDLTNMLNELKKLSLETRLDCLRTLLTTYINTQPTNHDTILKIAQRYFVDYGGDWVMTDEFLKWADSETEAGRKVHIPANLLDTVKLREKEEKDGML